MTSAAPSPAAAGTITIGGDLTVNRMGFGAMRVTGRGIWGDPPDRAAALALLRRFVARGVDFIDTADSYGPEVSERLLFEALHPYPAGLVIATKGGLVRPGPDRWEPDCRPAHLRAACDGSLRRLGVERIDLYQLHTVDRRVPIEDSVGTLLELQQAGKIRHIGLCNVDRRELERARRVVPIVSVQNRYNLADRASDPVLDARARDGLAFVPWYPLSAGALAGTRGPIAEVARRHRATPAQVALAWLLGRSPVVLPIPGTSSMAHFEENLAAATLRLGADEMAVLAG
jgi:aryl-alcohol dehydrogenase-like predicted oxidoreductase